MTSRQRPRSARDFGRRPGPDAKDLTGVEISVGYATPTDSLQHRAEARFAHYRESSQGSIKPCQRESFAASCDLEQQFELGTRAIDCATPI